MSSVKLSLVTQVLPAHPHGSSFFWHPAPQCCEGAVTDLAASDKVQWKWMGESTHLKRAAIAGIAAEMGQGKGLCKTLRDGGKIIMQFFQISSLVMNLIHRRYRQIYRWKNTYILRSNSPRSSFLKGSIQSQHCGIAWGTVFLNSFKNSLQMCFA